VADDAADLVPPDIRDVSFPIAVRGYDRGVVDAYVERVHRVIAELQATASPQDAVRQALERVGEQTTAILQQAQETADEIRASAQRDTDATTGRARVETEERLTAARAEAQAAVADAHAEADELIQRARAQADAILARSRSEAADRLRDSEDEAAALIDQLRELRADTDAIWDERADLLDDLRLMASRIEEEAAQANQRFPPPSPSAPGEPSGLDDGEELGR
jgi:DivIVA domain-containing protein